MSDVNENTSGSSDDELRLEFDLIYKHQSEELLKVILEFINYNHDEPINKAYHIVSRRPDAITDDDYDDPNYDYDEVTYNFAQYYTNDKNALLNSSGIDCDKLTFIDGFDNFVKNSMKTSPDIFKDVYVRGINTIPDGNLSRTLTEKSHYEEDDVNSIIRLGGVGLTKVPAYLKKYTDLDDIDLKLNNFVTINKHDFPLKVKGRLDLSRCEKLVSLGADNIPTVKSLDLNGCKAFRSISYPSLDTKILINHLNEYHLNIIDTLITSTEQIILPSGDLSDYTLAITIPLNYTSFKCNNTSMVIRYEVHNQLTNITTFLGMGIETYFYMKHSAGVYQLDIDKYIPNINNAKAVYDAYIQIISKYTNLLTNKSLKNLYNAIQPTSLQQFESVLNKIKTYNMNSEDASNIGLLYKLLMR